MHHSPFLGQLAQGQTLQVSLEDFKFQISFMTTHFVKVSEYPMDTGRKFGIRHSVYVLCPGGTKFLFFISHIWGEYGDLRHP